MKRIIIALAALLASSIMFAQNKVSVEYGDLSVLKEKKTATIEFDFSDAMVGEQTLKEYLKSKGDDYLADWPSDQHEAGGYFIKEFNHRRGITMKIRESESVKNADYCIVVTVLYYNPGNQVAKNIPLIAKDGASTISGYIEIFDKSTKKNDCVCKIVIDEVSGASYPADATRLGFTYISIVRKIEDLLEAGL